MELVNAEKIVLQLNPGLEIKKSEQTFVFGIDFPFISL